MTLSQKEWQTEEGKEKKALIRVKPEAAEKKKPTPNCMLRNAYQKKERKG